MKDRFLKDVSFQELTFTREDRNKVFEEINRMENNIPEKSNFSFKKQFTYFTASLLVIGLCILLFIPSTLQKSFHNGNSGRELSGVISENDNDSSKDKNLIWDKDFIALLSVKDEENRIPINMILSYNQEKNMMKVISIPRDTYSPIEGDDGRTIYDKLTFAYALGSDGATSIGTTVSKLFGISIDYYFVIDSETFSKMIDFVNGIEYELQEDVRVRALTQAVIELEQGIHQLNGEEILALVMDATYGRSIDEEDLVKLFSAVIGKLKNEITLTQLIEIMSKIEGNIPNDLFFTDTIELPSIQIISLLEGMIPHAEAISDTEGRYYYKFEDEFLNSVIEELTTFN